VIYDTLCIFCRGTQVEGSWHEDINSLSFGCVFIILMDGFKQFRTWYGASVGERQSGVGWTHVGNRLPRLVTFRVFPQFHKTNFGTFCFVWV